MPYKQQSKAYFRKGHTPPPRIWIYENQKGRRNSTKSQSTVLALELEDLYAEQAKERQGARNDLKRANIVAKSPQCLDQKSGRQLDVPKTTESVAQEVGVSPKTVERAGKFAQLHTHNKYPKSVKTLQRCKRLYAIAPH